MSLLRVECVFATDWYEENIHVADLFDHLVRNRVADGTEMADPELLEVHDEDRRFRRFLSGFFLLTFWLCPGLNPLHGHLFHLVLAREIEYFWLTDDRGELCSSDQTYQNDVSLQLLRREALITERIDHDRRLFSFNRKTGVSVPSNVHGELWLDACADYTSRIYAGKQGKVAGVGMCFVYTLYTVLYTLCAHILHGDSKHMTTDTSSKLREQIMAAKEASAALALATSAGKNAMLAEIARELRNSADEIVRANEKDLQTASKNHDRLRFDHGRLETSIREVEQVMTLKDFVGEVIEETRRPNGLHLQRVRVPLGVVLMIYEARPNVTIDSTVLALKSGNAVILKGGSDAIATNRAIVKAIHTGLRRAGVSEHVVTFIDSSDHSAVDELLTMERLIDVVIPRGGKGLIDLVKERSRIPVIETGASVVHMYIDEFADLEMARDLAVNSKTRRVSVCNALDVLLVHEKVAEKFFPMLDEGLKKSSEERGHPVVTVRGDSGRADGGVHDFDTEFLDYVLTTHVVGSLDEAIAHIAKHSLNHSECIVTENSARAEEFMSRVDSACVYWNASTQFSDGAQFGMGAEIGISTQKLHVRGPFALEGLTTYKWKIRGSGQIRPV